MKDKFKNTKGLDKAYMSLAKHYDERKENAIRQVKDGAFVDLLNKEQAELQKALKEKQIEEIAKDYYGYSIDLEEDCKFVAEEMYGKGHRKLTEDSVVLSGEEHEELKLQIQEAHNKGVRVGFDLTKFKENSIEQARKETAEKFANEVYKELYQLGKIYALPKTLDADKYGIFSLTQEVVAKIAKEQFGVEIKE